MALPSKCVCKKGFGSYKEPERVRVKKHRRDIDSLPADEKIKSELIKLMGSNPEIVSKLNISIDFNTISLKDIIRYRYLIYKTIQQSQDPISVVFHNKTYYVDLGKKGGIITENSMKIRLKEDEQKIRRKMLPIKKLCKQFDISTIIINSFPSQIMQINNIALKSSDGSIANIMNVIDDDSIRIKFLKQLQELITIILEKFKK